MDPNEVVRLRQAYAMQVSPVVTGVVRTLKGSGGCAARPVVLSFRLG